MDRANLKNEAKDLIRGNLWTIIKPYLIVYVIVYAISLIIMLAFGFRNDNPVARLFTMILSLAAAPMFVGCTHYMLKFVRKDEFSLNTVFSAYNNFVPIIIAMFLAGIFIFLWTLLLIIPGIIAALSYSQVSYILADGETDAIEAISESKEMMRGYKMEYFILQLSFLGWILLIPFTLGLLYIYVGPYITTANTLFYEKLKNKTFTNDVI